MGTKLEGIAAHIASRRGWPFVRLDDATLRIDLATHSLLVHAPEGFLVLSVRALFPTRVPPERRALAMEYLTRANVNVEVGHFELDLESGQVAFRTGMWTRGVALSDEILLNLFDTNSFGYFKYKDGLQSVVEGTATVSDAIEEASWRP